jgi:hypothetical protein
MGSPFMQIIFYESLFLEVASFELFIGISFFGILA